MNGDDVSLRDAAIELASNSELRSRFGANANNLLHQTFSVRSAAKAIIEHLD